MPRLLPFFAVMTLAATTWAQESMPLETVQRVKDATAYIRTSVDSDGDGPAMTGSGFLIRVDGTTGYVVTNAHVVLPRRGEPLFDARATTKVVFRSGTKGETRAVAEIVATAHGCDLALLRVTNVPNLPRAIDLGSDQAPFETMTVYIFGFPFGESLTLGKGNPPVNVGRGQVSSLRRNEANVLTSVLLDGALNPGNSGGPVVDVKGRLVGVSRATIRGANIGFAIAVPEVMNLLDGRVDDLRFASTTLAKGTAELAVEVPLLDPLGRIKSAKLLHTRGVATFSKTRRPDVPDDPVAPVENEDDARANSRRRSMPEHVFGPLEKADVTALTIDRSRASGVLKVPVAAGGQEFWCQVAYVDGSGKTVHAPPSRYLLGSPGPQDAGITVWGEVVDPDGDCRLALMDRDLVCEVPGTLHDLNVDIAKNNAPRVVQEVDGDFSAVVKVTGSFRPGEVRTGPKSVPYNGGGLLAWSDAGNYIRLERAAMHRNGRVVGFLAFENRKDGTRAEVHNKGGLDPAADVWVRLERRGATVSGFLSADGREWERLEPIEVNWPSRVKVGVDAVNSCGDAMTVRFQQFSLTKPAGVHKL